MIDSSATIVAVDGPAAAGKTTTAVRLADLFGLRYLESGRAYRLVAYLAVRDRVSLDSENALLGLYRQSFPTAATRSRMFAESLRFGAALRDRAVDQAVSRVAGMPALRAEITDLIRSWALAGAGSCVEGRDIGTTVFPAATVKFFLTARADVRARRRVEQQGAGDYQEILADVLRRDEADANRAVSPMVAAGDAIVLDTSDLSADDVVTRMSERCVQAGLTATRDAAVTTR